jgi:hypothetical protein
METFMLGSQDLTLGLMAYFGYRVYTFDDNCKYLMTCYVTFYI